VPFFLLLSPALKRDPRRLAAVAGGILVVHLLHSYWLIKPSFLDDGPTNGQRYYYGFDWWDPFALLAVGGLWTGAFVYFWQREERNHSSGGKLEESDHERKQTEPGAETGA
jgi:hypothetical protein